MRLSGLAPLLIGLAAIVGCGGGGTTGQYDKVDPAVDLAAAVKADIEQMKTAEGGAANEAMSFMENMEQRVEQAPADSKAVYEQIYAKAKELNQLAEAKEAKTKLDAVVTELEELAGKL